MSFLRFSLFWLWAFANHLIWVRRVRWRFLRSVEGWADRMLWPDED
jgi:hypothetical protein